MSGLDYLPGQLLEHCALTSSMDYSDVRIENTPDGDQVAFLLEGEDRYYNPSNYPKDPVSLQENVLFLQHYLRSHPEFGVTDSFIGLPYAGDARFDDIVFATSLGFWICGLEIDSAQKAIDIICKAEEQFLESLETE